MDTLTEHYQRYCEDPTSRHDLWNAIVGFEAFDQFADIAADCVEISQRYRPELPTTNLSTNGSTGAPKPYRISDFDFWCPAVEGLLRGCSDYFSVFVFNRPFIVQPTLRCFHGPNTVTCHMSLDDERQKDGLLKLLERPAVLIATPNTWLHITTALANEFNNTAVLHGVNTDWEMFGKFEKLTFPVRDQMIDWLTGINFYTCSVGEKHFLPLFHKTARGCKNLLNLAQRDYVPCEDELKFGASEQCKCGKRRLGFEFVGHCPNHLEMDRSFVLDHLEGGHINFQLIFDNGLHVYDVPTGEPQSFDWLDATVHLNQYFQIGAKAYNFWRSTHSNHLVGTFTSAANLAGHSSLMFL